MFDGQAFNVYQSKITHTSFSKGMSLKWSRLKQILCVNMNKNLLTIG